MKKTKPETVSAHAFVSSPTGVCGTCGQPESYVWHTPVSTAARRRGSDVTLTPREIEELEVVHRKIDTIMVMIGYTDELDSDRLAEILDYPVSELGAIVKKLDARCYSGAQEGGGQ